MADESKPTVDLRDYVHKDQVAHLNSQLEDMQAALEEQLALNDTLDKQVKELEPFKGQAEAAAGKLRGLLHERAYEKLAEELKIRPEFREDVWKLAGYEAKGDEPDEKSIREHIGKFLADRKHYTEEGKPTPARLPKGEGADRGAKPSGGDGKFRVHQANLNDPDWMERNMAKIADASKNDNFELVEA